MSAAIRRLPLFCLTLLLSLSHAGAASGQEKNQETTPPPPSPPGEERDWLEFYYQNPDPDRFVEKMREYSDDGTLVNEGARAALIGFLSQVIRQNPKKIADWYSTLRGLPPEEQQVLNTAMLHARVEEADAILKERLGEEFEKEKESVPKILEMKLPQVQTLDMLWGYFYATGSETAIRRIVSCFIYEDAPDNPEFAKVPEGFKPFYRELPKAASWSLASNAERHPKVLETLEKLHADTDPKTLNSTERRLLGELLAEIKAATPDPDPKPETGK